MLDKGNCIVSTEQDKEFMFVYFIDHIFCENQSDFISLFADQIYSLSKKVINGSIDIKLTRCEPGLKKKSVW